MRILVDWKKDFNDSDLNMNACGDDRIREMSQEKATIILALLFILEYWTVPRGLQITRYLVKYIKIDISKNPC